MDKALRPERFETLPNSSSSAKEFTHWHKTFQHYCEVLPQENLDKYKLLTVFLSPSVYDYVSECESYDAAIEALKEVYVKPTNEVFTRHLLATRKQKAGETLDEFLQALKTLSKDCNFKAVTAEKNRQDAIRDAFITGIQSNTIRQRLLENKTLELDSMFDQARSLETAQKNVESYSSTNSFPPSFNAAAAMTGSTNPNSITPDIAGSPDQFPNGIAHLNYISKPPSDKCWNCGNNRHPKSKCPARNAICDRCGRKGHFGNFCRSSGPKEHKEHKRDNTMQSSAIHFNNEFNNSNTIQQPQQRQQQQQQQQKQQQLQQQSLRHLIQLNNELNNNVQTHQPYLASTSTESNNTPEPCTDHNSMESSSTLTMPDNAQTFASTSQSGASPKPLRKAINDIYTNGEKVSALIDSGSSHSFMHSRLSAKLSLHVCHNQGSV